MLSVDNEKSARSVHVDATEGNGLSFPVKGAMNYEAEKTNHGIYSFTRIIDVFCFARTSRAA